MRIVMNSTGRCLLLALVCGLLPSSVSAQFRTRDHVFLPPTHGATVLSTYIDAQARHLVAAGDFLESRAIARRHHAAAAEHEIRNSVAWVKAYFERKEINRAYRKKYNLTYLQRHRKREKLKKSLVSDNPEHLLRGSLVDELNWMMDKLAAHELANEILYGTSEDLEFNDELSAKDRQVIMLTDGSRQRGSYVVFSATSGTPMDFFWPLALREDYFKPLRDEYDAARKAIAADANDGNVELKSWKRLQKVVDQLSAGLQRVYPKERRAASQEWLVYSAGKRFLQSQASMVFNGMLTNKTEYLSMEYAFEGETVPDLLRHMSRNGLRFADHKGTGDATYRKLFWVMRKMYLHYYENA